MTRRLTYAISALALGAALLSGCGGADDDEGDAGTTERAARFTIPGDRVFPEGVAVQKSTGDFFVGSTTDGAIYRGNVRGGELEPFLAAGADRRTAVTGLKVDDRGRLWVAGRFTGRVFVYDTRSKRLIRTLRAPAVEPTFSPREDPSLINDLTFTEDAVYITDSFQPVIYRVATAGNRIGRIEPWLLLQGTAAAYRRGFNLNGIAASDDDRHLISVNTDRGEIFRIDTDTREVQEVDLGGTTIRTADGILLDGRRLLVVREAPGEIVPVRLSSDLLSGNVGTGFGRSELAFPTTMAERNGLLLVVNSQLDRPQAPRLPFTLSGLRLPAL